MENWQTEESVDSLGVQLQNKRSTLLIVACILTWVGCIFQLVYLGMSFFVSAVAKAFDGTDDQTDLWFLLRWLVPPILCALGAIFMFLLRRWGFWIYCLGEIPPVLYSIYLMIGLTKNPGSGVFFGLLLNVFSIAFVIIYALEMNKLGRKQVSTDF
ncbi:hypothetical protein D3C87_309910 [compost metagenome]